MLSTFLYLACIGAVCLAAPVSHDASENQLNGDQKLDTIIHKLDSIIAKLDLCSEYVNNVMADQDANPIVQHPVYTLPKDVEQKPETVPKSVEVDVPVNLPELPELTAQPEIVEGEVDPTTVPEAQVPVGRVPVNEEVIVPDVPPMCFIECEFGMKTDDDGALLCACNEPLVSQCQMECNFGFKKNDLGEEICACNPAPVPECTMYCEYEFKKDEFGKNLCECNEAPVVVAVTQCATVMCANKCPGDLYVRTDDGCDTCDCVNPEVQVTEAEVAATEAPETEVEASVEAEAEVEEAEAEEAVAEEEEEEETSEEAMTRDDVVEDISMMIGTQEGTWKKQRFCPHGFAQTVTALVIQSNASVASMHAITFHCSDVDQDTSDETATSITSPTLPSHWDDDMVWIPQITCPINSYLAAFHVEPSDPTDPFSPVKEVHFACATKATEGEAAAGLVPAQEGYGGEMGWTMECPASTAFCGLDTLSPETPLSRIGGVRFSCCQL